jgi:hypothetical protein
MNHVISDVVIYSEASSYRYHMDTFRALKFMEVWQLHEFFFFFLHRVDNF